MSFAITEWNLDPNQAWYVKISDGGSNITVELYATEADAQAGTNLTASGTAAFGNGSEVVLAMDAAGSPEISLFNDALSYHLKVSGQDADTTKTFQVMSFVDLSEVSNSIYRSDALIQKRATFEINKHTHTSKIRDISVANHIPELAAGDVIGIQSIRRSLDVLATVTELTISGTPDSLINTVETVAYIDLAKE